MPTTLKPLTLTRSGPGVPVTRSYDYNAHQELCRQVEPETGATLMGYDAAGNLAWSASGLTVNEDCLDNPSVNPILARKATRTYDARNRLLTLTFPDGRGDQVWTHTPDGLPDTITTYNGAGHTLPVINAYNYNQRRMLAGQGESVQQPGWYTWGYGYGYDRNGHLAANTYPSTLAVTYAPNALGQPTQVGSYATAVSYFPNGAIKQFTYGNGVVHTLTANARGLPYRSRDALGTAEVLDDYYDYDPNGNVAGITDATTGQSQRRNRDMTYDGLDRLKTTQSPMWGNVQASYTYDVLDNLIQVFMPQYVPKPGDLAQPERNHHYCYDDFNRLTNVKTGSCTGTTVIGLGYDVQGNLANKSGTGYAFDFGNRLRTVSASGGATLETYRYDGLGRRVLSWAPTGGNIVSQYSQAGQLVYQYDSRASEQSAYLYLGNSLVARHTVPFGTQTAVIEYQHTDALGSPAAVTDANGVVLRRDEYEPYGKRLNRANDNRPGYTGHVMDEATGLTYMQQRYYDPAIGMFLSVDPVTAYSNPVGQFHRYRYANNNPYKFTDPDGRSTVKIDIQRVNETEKSTAGTINVASDGSTKTFSGQTLEPPREANDVSGNGTVRMQEGEYDAFVRGPSATGNHDKIQLEGTIPGEDGKGHTAIQIHAGNKPTDSQGCVLVGTGAATDWVSGSRDALGQVMDVVYDTQAADALTGETTEIVVTIRDIPPE